MRKISFFAVALIVTLIGLTFSSCSEDSAEPQNPLIGTWQQTNSSGTRISITFHEGGAGNVNYTFYNDAGEYTGDSNERFSYDYYEEERELTVIGDTQLEGNWDVKIAENTLILEGWLSGTKVQYRFTRI